MNINFNKYCKDGMLIKKNYFPINDTSSLFHAFVNILNKYLEINGSPLIDLSSSNWNDESLHNILKNLRTTDPITFGNFYNAMKINVELHRIFYNQKIMRQVAELLNVPETGLCISGQMLRIDSPVDKRNSLAWHQDSSYYLQNKSSKNGLVCWVPMMDVDFHNGTLQYLKGSHNEGLLSAKSSGKGDLVSEQFKIEDKVISKYTILDAKMQFGDVGFFTMDMIHRSGSNQSKKFRIVAGARYHNMLAHDFRVGEFKYNYLQ